MSVSPIGARLGKYEIQGEMGRGGMGMVYQAYDPLLDRRVAIKVLAPHLAWEQNFVQRFLREARAAARLRHPNIVTIYDVGQEGSWYYFVMEFLEGHTLSEIIKSRGALRPREVVGILRPLADALDYAHRQLVVHRDIKPSNVMVGADGQVRLADFGIARAAQEVRLTSTGTIVGTPEYMSPEQARGEEVDWTTDLYSLGVVAYEMLCGRVPFGGTTPHAVLHKQIYEPPPTILGVRPELPPEVASVLDRALAKDPAKRYDSVTAFVEALDQATSAAAPPAVGKPSTAATPVMPTGRTKATAPATPQPEERPAKPTPAPARSAVVEKGPAAKAPPVRQHRSRIAWLLGAFAVLVLAAVVAGVVLLAGGGSATPTPSWPPATALPRAATRTPSIVPREPTGTSPRSATPIAQATGVQKAPSKFRVGLVIDSADVLDGGFSQSCWDGLQRAQKELGVEAQYLGSQTPNDYERNLSEFAQRGYDLVTGAGYSLGDAMSNAARRYPETKFAIADFSYEPPIPNVEGMIFTVEEAAFPAGYLAAGWAQLQDPADPQVGYVAGAAVEPVKRFVIGYENGVKYYNSKMGKDVKVDGVVVGSFDSPEDGKVAGYSLIDGGVDVLFNVGGLTGNGALLAAKERGKWGVGVDLDQYHTLPEVRGILLTSVLKRLDNAVYGLVEAALRGEFKGGTNYIGRLDNGGVGLAPYHDFEDKIPSDLKVEVDTIVKQIIDGTIQPGEGAASGAASGSAHPTAFKCTDPMGCVDLSPGESVRIGWILAVSGPEAALGTDALRGVELALDARKSVLLDHPIELVGLDSRCSAEGGLTAAKKLSSVPKLIGVVGTSCSSEARSALPVMCGAGMPVISPSSTSSDLTASDRPGDYWCFMRTAWNDVVQGTAVARFAREALKAQRAATCHDGSVYAVSLQQVFSDVFTKLGGTITAQETVAATDTDLQSMLVRVADAKPELLYYPVFSTLGSHITQQARQIPALQKVVLAGSDALFSPEFLKLAGDAAVGMLLSSPDTSAYGAGYEEFVKRYQDKYGERPVGPFHAQAYDAANLLLAAIERVAVKEADGALHIPRKALHEAMLATKGLNGLTGALTCNELGDCAVPSIAVSEVASTDPARWKPGSCADCNPRRIWP